MHIHRFSYDYPPPWWGLAPGVFELTKAQCALGHTIEVFAGEWPAFRSERAERLRVYRLPRTLPGVGPFLTYAPAAAVRWLFAEAQPDVIHGHNFSSIHVSLRPRRGRSWAYVLHLHSTAAARSRKVTTGIPLARRMLEWRLAESAERVGCQVADAVVCVSESVAEEAAHYYKVNPGRLTVVLNGVDGARFSPEGENLRASLGVSDRKVLLYVGTLSSRKRVDVLVRALALLPKDYVLLIAGSGPACGGLEILVSVLGLAERVRFLGVVPHGDLPKYYRSADLLCLVSSGEGLPKVVLEALACCLPVVSTCSFRGSQGIDDMITWLHGNRPEEIAAELLDATSRAARPHEGRARVLRDYTWEKVARRVDVVYSRLL